MNSQEYRELISNPRYWDVCGTRLLDAAFVLWDRIEPRLSEKDSKDEIEDWAWPTIHMIGPYYLLVGLAIENRLKAVWVGRKWPDISDVPDDLSDLKEFDGHKLKRLAESVPIETTDAQASLLDHLGDMVLWQGRYPAPKKLSGDRPFVVDSASCEVIWELIELIDTHYYALWPKR